MPSVTFLPLKITVEVPEGTSILDSALDFGIDLENNCGGNCACASCHVIIEIGTENLSQKKEDEDDQLDFAAGLTLNSRLGCQAKVYGNVTVRIPSLG